MKIHLPVLSEVNAFRQKYRKDLQKLKGLKNLDLLMNEAHHQTFATIDCLQCANCCRTTGPLFLERDVKRISKHLGIPSGAFIEQYLQLDEDGDYVLKSVPCTFLQADNICEIYEVRPKACRQYPHTDQRGQSKIYHLTLKNAELCPAVLNTLRILVSKSNS
ncbi:MAG: YkgJ family cysteine cluster protein [Saprospiraceae bacterium]|nr:YkgJ family cysteine cluster protein [Saprospiraceae bacterium]